MFNNQLKKIISIFAFISLTACDNGMTKNQIDYFCTGLYIRNREVVHNASGEDFFMKVADFFAMHYNEQKGVVGRYMSDGYEYYEQCRLNNFPSECKDTIQNCSAVMDKLTSIITNYNR